MLVLLHTADDILPRNRVGRARAKLPEEYQLAQFIQDVKGTLPSWNTDTPACLWNKVDCNRNGDIRRVNWSNLALNGTLRWVHLSIIMCSHIFLGKNELKGEVDLESLPRNIRTLSGHHNHFEGTLNLDEMPRSLHTLDLSDCELHGSISLRMLSPALRGMFLSRNDLSGSLDFGAIPTKFCSLSLMNNNFSGPVDLQHLPYRIRLELHHNPNLRGEFDPIWFYYEIGVWGTQIKILPKRGSYMCFLPFRYALNSDVWQF